MSILALLYFLSVLIFAFRRFGWAVYLCVALLPAYIIRPQFGPLPTSILELTFIAVLITGVAQITRKDYEEFKVFITHHKTFWLTVVAFLFFSCMGAVVAMNGAVDPVKKLVEGVGEWRAMFFEPVLFCILLLIHQRRIRIDRVILSLLGSAVVVSVIAVVQKITGTWFPPSIADTYLFGRVTSVYTSANAIGLFVVPIIFLSTMVWNSYKVYVSVGWVCIFLALFFSQSQGALIAFGAATLVYLLIRGYIKIAATIVVVGILSIAVIPSLRAAVMFEDRAGQNRIMVWKHTVAYLTENPTHFIAGAGIRNFFDAVQSPWHDVTVLEVLKYPHNMFLNFWVEIGLIGMILFVSIVAFLIRRVWSISDMITKAALVAALTAIMVHGLVDVPYFKNDLAMLFWIIAAIILMMGFRKERYSTLS